MIDLIHSVINTPRTRKKPRTRKNRCKGREKTQKTKRVFGFFYYLSTFRVGKVKKVPLKEEQLGGMGGIGKNKKRLRFNQNRNLLINRG